MRGWQLMTLAAATQTRNDRRGPATGATRGHLSARMPTPHRHERQRDGYRRLARRP